MNRWISKSSFEKDWSGLHRAVFKNWETWHQPFSRGSWSTVLLVDALRLDEVERGAIATVTHSCGDADFVAVDAERRFPDGQFAAIGTWARESLQELWSSWLGHTTVHVFGRSAAWALAASNEGVAVFGAESELMSAFIEKVGGIDYLKEKFLDEFATELDAAAAGDPSARWILQTLESVGWRHI